MALCQIVAYSICDNPCIKLDFFDPFDCINIIPQKICFQTNILQCKSTTPETEKTATNNNDKSVKTAQSKVESAISAASNNNNDNNVKSTQSKVGSVISVASNSNDKSVKPAQSKAGSVKSATTNNTKKSTKSTTKVANSDKFCIHLSVNGFDRETIKTKIDGGKVVVEANQEDRQDDGDFYIRQFKKSYDLPKQADITKMNSHITLDNVLVVEVPFQTENNKLPNIGQSQRSRASLSSNKKSTERCRSQERNSSIQSSNSTRQSENKFSIRSRSVKSSTISQGQQTKPQSVDYGQSSLTNKTH
ncbi:hypothetical protein I4U23_031329 [Adineta vaga]|nr:hypothetical protein I4U23_031329 [Adineta vaga]